MKFNNIKQIYIWKWACEIQLMPEYKQGEYIPYSDKTYSEILDLALTRNLYVMLHVNKKENILEMYFDKQKFNQR